MHWQILFSSFAVSINAVCVSLDNPITKLCGLIGMTLAVDGLIYLLLELIQKELERKGVV